MTRTLRLVTMCVIALILCAPVSAATPSKPAVTVIYFTLDKTEAAKGDQVMASWSFTGRARRVAISAATEDGLLLNSWRVFPAGAGVLTFTVPYSLYTLSPLSVTLNVDGVRLNSIPLLITCDNPWFFTPRSSRCPAMPIQPSPAAYEEFEHGRMVWIGNRDHIYVFYDADIASEMAGRWETFEDLFNEGDPETDPSITPPEGKIQPKRGFGLVWRTQEHVRAALGWALNTERGYTACFGGGFVTSESFASYLNDADNRVMALHSDYFPTTWNVYTATEPIRYTGCGE